MLVDSEQVATDSRAHANRKEYFGDGCSVISLPTTARSLASFAFRAVTQVLARCFVQHSLSLADQGEPLMYAMRHTQARFVF